MAPRVPGNLVNGISQRFVAPTALRMHLQSPNMIADPYDPNATLWTRFKKFFYSATAYARLKQSVREYSPSKFAKQAIDDWKTINSALCTDDKSTLRDHVSELALSKFKSRLRALSAVPGKQLTLHWNMESVKDATVVSHRVAKIQGTDDEFAQVTVRLRSLQTVAVLDTTPKKKGGHAASNPTSPAVVSGSVTDPIELTEYLVFERNINKAKSSQARWLFIGSIDAEQKAIAAPTPAESQPPATTSNKS